MNKEINPNKVNLNPQDSFGNEDFITNEGRKTGKFHKLTEEKEKDLNNNNKKNISQNSIKVYNEKNNNKNKNNNRNISKKLNKRNKSKSYKTISPSYSIRKYNNINNSKQINNNTIIKKKFKGVKMNKYSLYYFCYLINHYLKKMSFKMCINEIVNYQKYLEKKYALKIIYRMMKKRIIFYKIKFFRRRKKIYRFLIKYEERVIIHNKNNYDNSNNRINYK